MANDQLIFPVRPSGICALTSCRIHVEPHQEDAQEDQLRQFSQSSASSRDNMSVDSSRRTSVSQEDTTPTLPRNRIRIRIRVLTTVEQIVARNGYEREALELLKKQSFSHIKVFEPLFLIKTGLKQDMNHVFAYAGWENFAHITETGSHLLTMEFLMSLGIEETSKITKIYFRFFDEQYELTVTQLSGALGFHKKCLLDPTLLKTINMIALPGGTQFLMNLLAMEKKEPVRRSVAGPVTRGRSRLSTQQEQTSYSPQVGLSTTPRYDYENPIIRSITNRTDRVNIIESTILLRIDRWSVISVALIIDQWGVMRDVLITSALHRVLSSPVAVEGRSADIGILGVDSPPALFLARPGHARRSPRGLASAGLFPS
ncbi:Zinc knuckle family protein [Panicum miliaceum]|uniref:Zinc knuckle family protein n=1 Tax=Panicum miliaceum TaxID=4540 RepID=A0A3L6QJV4_PANMI|nr:Zinc knuckle family protein [Panicum miliaceum]